MAALQLKAALLILGIAAGRKLLFRFFSPRLPEWLWMLVGIRLLLPQGIGIPILSVRHLCAPYPCDPFAAPLPGVAVWVRWSGAGAVLLILLANALRFYGRMRQKEDLQNDAVSGWIQAHSRGPRFRVYTSAMAASPMVYGLFSPKIVLPAQQYSETQYRYILLHEWMHIRRKDLWKKALMLAVAVLHWYNPACWLMLALFNRDIELACDADVLQAMGKTEHAGYAHVLLDCYCRMNPSATLKTGFLSGTLQERIGAIMNQKKISMKAKCGVVFLFAALFLASFGKVSVQTEVSESMPILIGKTAPETEEILQEEGYAWKVEKARYMIH